MASYVSVASNNSTTAATWGTVTNTPTIHASTNLTTSTGGLFTATFTSPGAANNCLGAMIFVATPGVSGTMTVTLQDATVDTASTVTVNNTSLKVGWNYLVLGAPYLLNNLGAGNYRFRVKHTTTSDSVAADSGATLPAYMAVDDRTGVPASGDQAYVAGPVGGATTTVTQVGTTQTYGNATDLTVIINRTVGYALQVCNNAIYKFDTTANTTVAFNGCTSINSGGEWQIGTSGVPYAFNGKVIYTNTVALNCGGFVALGGKQTWYGATKTYYKTTFTSGTGTAASPFVVADPVAWSVGDELFVCPSSSNAGNATEGEYRFIITVNSSTSYVLSSTSGGAENALVNSHTGADILNITRNIVVTTSDITKQTYWNNLSLVQGDANMQWSRFEYVGGNVTSKLGVTLCGGSNGYATADYSVAYKSARAGFFMGTPASGQTWNGLIAVGGTGLAGIYYNNATSHTLNDCYAVGITGTGFNLAPITSSIFNRCKAIGCSTGWAYNAVASLTFNSCEAHCSNGSGVGLNNSTYLIHSNCLYGSKGKSQTSDVSITTNTLNAGYFINCTFGSPTLASNYLNGLAGSLVSFHAINLTDNYHKWYTNYGSAQATGSGLADTTVRTVSSLGVRLSPENNTTGFSWSFQIPARANSVVGFTGFFQKNVAFGTSVATISLYLPGLVPGIDAASTSYNLPNTTGSWLPVNIVANYTSSINALATIVVTGITATASAYLYCDDFYNAGDGTTTFDRVTGLDVWYNGLPASVIAPQTPSAADIAANVWAVQTSTLTTAGTTGKAQKDGLTTAKFIGLK